jgi:fibronectin type 3 domain-containing protein
LEDTIYYFKVKAFDEVSLCSIFSNRIFSPTLDLTPPQPPTSLLFTEIGGTFLNLSWTSSISVDIEGYRIYINDTASSTNFHLLGLTQNNFYNATGLLEEITYYFEIRAVDEVPWESLALAGNNTTIDITPPKAPTNLAIFNLNHDFINITWSPSTSSDIQGYEIYLNDTGSATKFYLLNTTKNIYYNYSGLQEEITCYFKIRAYDEVPLFSSFSSVVWGSTLDVTPPSPPTSLVISKVGGRFVELSWVPSISPDVVGYEIYINDTDSSVNYHYSAKTTNNYYNHTGLVEETTYSFRIQAFDEVPLFSIFSNTAKAITPDVTSPKPPTSLIISEVGGTFLNLSWSESVSPDIEGYQIFINDSGSKFYYHSLIITTNCYFNYSGLPEETTYYFKILAFDEVPLYSIFSNIAYATTLDITEPKPPAGLIAKNPTKNKITLKWNPNPEDDIAGYNIYINDTNGGPSGLFLHIHTIIDNDVQFTITGLREKTTYYFVVTAFDEVPNNSLYSNVASATTLDKTPPHAPSGLKATVISGTEIVLNWNPNQESDLIGYHIFINDINNNATGKFHIISTLYDFETSYTVNNLMEKTTYFFKLKAFDNVPNNSPYSEVVSATTLDETPPSIPIGLSISNSKFTNLTISWIQNPEDDILGYKLFRSLSPNWTFKVIKFFPIIGTQYIDTGLDENTKYYYKIKAIDTSYLESEFSEWIFGITQYSPQPPKIRNHIPDFRILEDSYDDESIRLFEWFMDVNTDQLKFRCEGAKNITVTLFDENGTVILKPIENWNGEETLTFYASDEIFDEIFDIVTITVEPINDPPLAPTIIKPENNIIFTEKESIDFEGRCSDPDLHYGDELTFTWFSSINGKLGNGSTIKNIYLDVGEHLITLNVSDISGETSETFIFLTVKESSNGKENQENIVLIIGSIGVFIIILILILVIFMHIKKKETYKIMSALKEEIESPIESQLPSTRILPSSPSPSISLAKKRPKYIPVFRCPSCGDVIYEENKCLNCGWIKKS